MGIFTRERKLDIPYRQVSTMELAERYDLIEVRDGTILVKDPEVARQLSQAAVLDQTPSQPEFRELGGTGQSNYTGMAREDYNPELRGLLGLKTYDRMRKNDGQVRGILRLVKTPVLAARWYVDTEDESKRGEIIRDHIQNCLFKYMTTSFPEFLTEICAMLDFGYYPFEKVFDFRDGKVIWRKFAPRHPMDVVHWNFDEHGGPRSVTVRDALNILREVEIPMYKLALFTYDKEAGNVTGVSVLRSAYKHWYYKENFYKIDAVQKERHGVGVPIIKLPSGFNTKDASLAEEMGRNLRTNEKAHIVLPPFWEIMMLKMEGNPVDALKSAEHHDLMIARNILAQFMNQAGGGNSIVSQQDMFLKATRYIADTIRDVINRYCIPQLVMWNWGERDIYPELCVRRIGDTTDWRTISFALRNFIGAGVVVPDETLESWIRDEMDLPKADTNTSRVQVTPQLPRQATAANANKGTGNSSAGGDTSGGQ